VKSTIECFFHDADHLHVTCHLRRFVLQIRDPTPHCTLVSKLHFAGLKVPEPVPVAPRPSLIVVNTA